MLLRRASPFLESRLWAKDGFFRLLLKKQPAIGFFSMFLTASFM